MDPDDDLVMFSLYYQTGADLNHITQLGWLSYNSEDKQLLGTPAQSQAVDFVIEFYD